MIKKISLGVFISAVTVIAAILFLSQNNNTQISYSKNVEVTPVNLEKIASESQENIITLAQQPPEIVKNIPVIVYHSIAPTPTHSESAMQKRFRIDPENFTSQMQYLQDNKYTPITFDHYSQYLLHDKEIPDKPIVLTFDDGLDNQFQYAFPILQKFNFTGTFFIYPGVTNHNKFMSWEELQTLVDNNYEIGSHTVIHYNLTSVDDEVLQNELVESKKILEDKLGITVTTLAYPHYAENETVRAAVLDAGYIAARAGWRAVTNSADEIFHLKAQEAENKKGIF